MLVIKSEIPLCLHFVIVFFKDFVYLFLERGELSEKERERNINVCGCAPPTRDLARNQGMCPDWELNP